MKRKKLSKYEKTNQYRAKLAASLAGSGLFVFRNHTNGDLYLPKPSADGKRIVKAGQTWKGDSYFMSMVTKTHEALLVETLQTAEERNKMEQKLIVDQPDCITTKGKVEQVLVQPETMQKLNEQPVDPNQKKEDVLLNDDAIDGVEIIIE